VIRCALGSSAQEPPPCRSTGTAKASCHWQRLIQIGPPFPPPLGYKYKKEPARTRAAAECHSASTWYCTAGRERAVSGSEVAQQLRAAPGPPRSGQVQYSAKIGDHESHKAAWAASRVSTGLNLATLD
jgi:hypothetical protein